MLLREHQRSLMSSMRGSLQSLNNWQRQSVLDVSIRSTEDEHSAFVTAAHMGCTDILAMLLDLGVPVDTTDMGGWTALHAACDSGHVQVCELHLTTVLQTCYQDALACMILEKFCINKPH